VGDDDVGVVEGCLVDAVGVYFACDAAHPVVFLVGSEEASSIVVAGGVPAGVDLGGDGLAVYAAEDVVLNLLPGVAASAAGVFGAAHADAARAVVQGCREHLVLGDVAVGVGVDDGSVGFGFDAGGGIDISGNERLSRLRCFAVTDVPDVWAVSCVSCVQGVSCVSVFNPGCSSYETRGGCAPGCPGQDAAEWRVSRFGNDILFSLLFYKNGGKIVFLIDLQKSTILSRGANQYVPNNDFAF
jgi:hypothetical protein